MSYVYSTADDVAVADERPMLEAFLDHHRQVVVAKVRGVSDEDAGRRLVPSMTTLGGLLLHLRRVETSWFQHRLAQVPLEDLPLLRSVQDDPARDFHIGPGDTVHSLIADYEAQCVVSRRTASRFALDHVVPHTNLGQVSLRWIYLHMIEETARHAGHADILREQIDGAVGG